MGIGNITNIPERESQLSENYNFDRWDRTNYPERIWPIHLVSRSYFRRPDRGHLGSTPDPPDQAGDEKRS